MLLFVVQVCLVCCQPQYTIQSPQMRSHASGCLNVHLRPISQWKCPRCLQPKDNVNYGCALRQAPSPVSAAVTSSRSPPPLLQPTAPAYVVTLENVALRRSVISVLE